MKKRWEFLIVWLDQADQAGLGKTENFWSFDATFKGGFIMFPRTKMTENRDSAHCSVRKNVN